MDIPGPFARAMDTLVCESPFVAPSARLFGATAVMNIYMQPGGAIALSNVLHGNGRLTVSHIHNDCQDGLDHQCHPDKWGQPPGFSEATHDRK
jgi:hypothetical protein